MDSNKDTSTKSRMYSIIIDECLRRKIDIKCIEFGCEYAELLLDANKGISNSILAGVATAESMQENQAASSNRK